MAKRKPRKNNAPITVDLDDDLHSPISEIYREQLSKHRTCWMHVLASSKAQKKRITKSETEVIKKRSPCFLNFPHRERSTRRFKHRKDAKQAAPLAQKSTKRLNHRKDANQAVSLSQRSTRRFNHHKDANQAVSLPREKQKLNSEEFSCYFENLWKSFSEDKRTSFTYLDCLWFDLYMKKSYKAKVLTWIKKKHIFSKKYVLVPIVCWSHWRLLILCHIGESVQSETQKPCMLLLDSLEKADPRQLEPYIKRFVKDIYEAEGTRLIYDIPLLVPQVPQQRDDVECGNFVLYYINLFMEGAPENFSIEGYPYFMKKNWFTPERLDCFCQKLYSSAK